VLKNAKMGLKSVKIIEIRVQSGRWTYKNGRKCEKNCIHRV